MDLRGDERAQPVVIGSLLIFTILILAFATYQGAIVPNQNSEVEYNHFQGVEGQFSELRTSATNAIGSGEQRSVTISLGARYPPRLIALNPSAPSGSLETTGEGEVEIEGLNYSAANVCATDETNITSRSLHYQPNYHEHRSAESITYENTFRARSFRDGQTQFDGQSLVQPGNGDEATKINLMILTGSFSRSGGDSFDLDLNPTHRHSVVVDPNGDFSVTVPSRFTAAQWEDQILADADITSVEQDGDQVKIQFPEGEYRISCAALGLNSQPAYQPPGGDRSDPTFDTRWDENRTITVRPSRGSITLSMIATDLETGDSISNASVDYAYSPDDGNSGQISIGGMKTGVTNETGQNDTSIDLTNAEHGDIYDVYVTAGDESDLLTLEIEEPPFFEVLITDTDSPVQPGDNVSVNADISNSGGEEDTQDIILDIYDNEGNFIEQADVLELTIPPDETSSITLTWQTEESDATGTYTVEVHSQDSEGTDEVTVRGGGGNGPPS